MNSGESMVGDRRVAGQFNTKLAGSGSTNPTLIFGRFDRAEASRADVICSRFFGREMKPKTSPIGFGSTDRNREGRCAWALDVLADSRLFGDLLLLCSNARVVILARDHDRETRCLALAKDLRRRFHQLAAQSAFSH
jgi:hypothetical protein